MANLDAKTAQRMTGVLFVHGLKVGARATIRVAALIGGFMLANGRALGVSAFLEAVERCWPYALAFAALGFVLDRLFRTDRQLWRYISVVDVLPIVRTSTLLVTLFLVIVFFVDRAQTLPRSMLLLVWMLDIALTLGLSLARRIVHDKDALRAVAPFLAAQEDKTPLLLIGHLDRAELFLRDLRNAGGVYRPLGIFATDVSSPTHREVRGVRILPTLEVALDAVQDLASHGKSPAVVFVDGSLTPADLGADRLGRLRGAGVKLLRVPSLIEMGTGADPRALREFQLEELLSRAPVKLDEARLRTLISGRRVLVTGAGGSIGSEICRQVASLGCAHLALLDNSEFGLFRIDQEIGDRWPTLSRHEYLRDIRHKDRLEEVFTEVAPDLVFHAAALKHVPMMERHPCEAVLTNVVGTWNVAQSAAAAKAAQMVFISTDKAVDPPNIMGATKRIAEAVVRAQQTLSGATRFSAVRFGNVLGSAGSVVPTFRAQIERGGPVTLTHPDIERYFMTIPEAVQLVLHATAVSAEQADAPLGVYVLDMGKPVKIMDLARQLIELYGKEPDQDIAIEVTGLRPGEKLFEELVDSTEDSQVCGESLIRVTDRLQGARMSDRMVRELEAAGRANDARRARELVMDTLAKVRATAPETTSAVVSLKRG